MVMSASASGDEVALPGRAGRAAPGARRGILVVWAEVALAVIAFAVLCVAVLSVAAQSAEPDDGAYRASIVAMTDRHFLSLSTAQAKTLARKLGDNPAAPPNQWVELSDGRYISEKDPGYPFLAAPFQALEIIRWAPLFYGALACFGLFIGARCWLGRFGGLAAVGLYCSSGAALIFAWRIYMPTFTDASLIAAGSGALLWSVLATETSSRRRTWAGLAGFVALEIATFVRYTDIVILGCAVVAVIVAWRLRAARLPLRTLCWWLASVAVFGAGVAIFDDLIYGGPLTTGYAPGQVLRSRDRRDFPARRLAGDQDSRPCLGSRPDLNRRHHRVVQPGRVVVPRHVAMGSEVACASHAGGRWFDPNRALPLGLSSS